MNNLTQNEMSDALSFATLVADQAQEIFDEYHGEVDYNDKPDGTPVTEVDLRIEQMVERMVARNRQGEQVLGEENLDSHQPTSSKVWVVDPIDGTELFAHGQAGYVFSMALVVDGQTEVALVRDPRAGSNWYATRGGGAWRDGQRLQVSSNTRLKGSKLRAPRGPADDKYLWPEVVSTVRAAGVQTLNIGSVVRSAMDVADGTLDGVIFGRSGPWDVAAGALIVPEAGGRFTDLLGRDQRLDGPVLGAIISNLWFHEDLVQVVAEQAR